MRKYISLFSIVLLALGIVVGFFAGYSYHPHRRLADGTPVRQSFDFFVNPLIGFDVAEEISLEEYGILKTKIEENLETRKSSGQIEDASIYFKDPSNGKWFGVNADKEYHLGSLAKVPLLMSYARSAETNPELLDRKITANLKEDFNKLQSIKPKQSIENGKAYTIANLLSFMIQYSDNNASTILGSIAQADTKNKIYQDFGITESFDRETKVSPKQFSLFFRSLFNSTYLGRVASSEALKLLAATNFKDGLVLYLPSDVVVSHKFGEYRDSSTDQIEFHDCGIVYKKSGPYGLCIMTIGKSIKDQQGFIADISKLVYESL